MLRSEYARIILLKFYEDDEKLKLNPKNKILIEKELHRIYLEYEKNFKSYIDKSILSHLQYTTSKVHKTRHEDKRKYEFQKILTPIAKLLNTKEYYTKLFEIILGYIHLQNLDFNDDILLDYNFTINASITEMSLVTPQSEHFVKHFEQYHQLRYITKTKKKSRGYREEMYAIAFRPTDPLVLFRYAINDEDFLLKTHQIFTQDKVYFRLSIHDQRRLKSFLDKKREETVQIFHASKDGVLPLIPKDVVSYVMNDYLFRNLDIRVLAREMVEQSDKMIQEFLEKSKNLVFNHLDDFNDDHKLLFVLLIKDLLDLQKRMHLLNHVQIKNIYQEKFKVAANIFKVIDSHFGKTFCEKYPKFGLSVKDKRRDLISEAKSLHEKGNEDVEWFLESIQN